MNSRYNKFHTTLICLQVLSLITLAITFCFKINLSNELIDYANQSVTSLDELKSKVNNLQKANDSTSSLETVDQFVSSSKKITGEYFNGFKESIQGLQALLVGAIILVLLSFIAIITQIRGKERI